MSRGPRSPRTDSPASRHSCAWRRHGAPRILVVETRPAAALRTSAQDGDPPMRAAFPFPYVRRLLQVTLALGAGSLQAQAQAQLWTKQAPLPTAEDLHAVQMLSATEIWATGGEGLLVHSLDAGETWQSQNLPTNSLWALFFLDAQ